MPRFDGTGPRGMGPMTGRGMGYCAVPLPRSRDLQPLDYHYGSRDSEIAYLKDNAQSIQYQIKKIEATIKTIEKSKPKR
jgi:hypothetical protein